MDLDDFGIGASLKALGTPPEASTPELSIRMLEAVENRRRRRSRHRVAGGVVVGGLALVGGVVAWPGFPGAELLGSTGESAEVRVSDFRYGFGWEMDFAASRDGDIGSAAWRFGSQSADAVGYDDNVYSGVATRQLFDVSSGDRIYMEAHLVPRCDGSDAPPELSITWTDGAIQRVTTSNPEQFNNAVATWCQSPVLAAVDQTTVSSDGASTSFVIDLHNPGQHAVTVTARDLVSGEVHWHGGTLTVDAGQDATLQLRVTSLDGDPLRDLGPWPDNWVEAEGRTIEVIHSQ